LVDALEQRLRDAGYIADSSLITAVDLVLSLQRPLLLEGEAGVGKTEIAKALATVLQTRLIRLQCYEGLDANAAIYEWNYQRQLLAIKAREQEHTSAHDIETHIFSHEYLLPRPLLQALMEAQSPVLLIDEIDRADQEFEAYLLEILSDYQITVPELGTQVAKSIPHVILTSNGTRELSDALRRRCLYTWVPFPEPHRELEIIRSRLPGIERQLAEQLVNFVHSLRQETLDKTPGIAETLDWAAALLKYDVRNLVDDLALVQKTLICLLKTEPDLNAITPEVTSRLAGRAA
jgi:MoxR-like ATPase